jgi:hypothetical protein
MKQPNEPHWEDRVQRVARTFVYPPTPDLVDAVQRRLIERRSAPDTFRRLRPAWAIGLAVVLLLAGLLTVPPVRAAIREWLQIGAVRIWLVEPTPTASSLAPAPPTIPTPLTSLFDLAGATTLADAQSKATFPLRLPTYPADLGDPDGVFFQELGGDAVIFVWLDAAQPARARLSLHILGPNTFAEKGNSTRLEQTTVNGQPAFWTEGPYMLAYRRGTAADLDMRRLIEGHVLIWREGDLTYRLETDLPLPEAARVAESLVTIPPPALNLTGKTTLAKAQAQLDFPMRLPTQPADLGAPDHIFVQETNGRFAVLVWMEPADPQRVRLVLYEIGPGVGIAKGPPPVLRETLVNGRAAAWLEGSHYLEHVNGDWGITRFIDQDVLVWSELVEGKELTYRLETALSEAQAIAIAESLQ